MALHAGGCQCGAVRYEAELDLREPVIECDCSHCRMKGLLLAFIPAKDFLLMEGSDVLTEYRFNKKAIAHLFCRTCGVQPIGRGEGRDGAPMIAVNVRTLDDIDFEALARMPFNGKDL